MDANKILLKKANSYGYRSWFSKGSFLFPNYPLNREGFFAIDEAINEAQNIDCIWFEGDLKMHALFKVCSENFIEGLYRLNNVKESLPPFLSKYFLIVDDNYHQNAVDELMKPTFKKSGILIIKKSDLFDMPLNEYVINNSEFSSKLFIST